MTEGGFSLNRLTRVRRTLERHVEAGHSPGVIAAVARHGEVYIETAGNLSFLGAGSRTPMAGDTIFRIASWTKPIIAACVMTLVEDGTLNLDYSVDALLPELSNMTVLADPNGSLDNTVPAKRAITLRDLLTCRLGTGSVNAEPGTVPISDALHSIEQTGYPEDPGLSPDEWIRRLGQLPLIYQPGERWMYYIGPILLGMLISRATGMPLEDVLHERICGPLGMKDTSFIVKGEGLGRLAAAYVRDSTTGELVVEGGSSGTRRRSPAYKAASSGLFSTVNDFLAFTSALRTGGIHHGSRILSRSSVTLMTSNHLTPAQKTASKLIWTPVFLGDYGWGFGMAVNIRNNYFGPSAGSYGWWGKYGTAWFNDPVEDLTAILAIQNTEAYRMPVFANFPTTVYQAIED